MKKMKKGIVLPVVLFVFISLGTASAGAQARLEANLNWPLTIGLGSNSTVLGDSSFDLSQYHLLVPDFRAYYQFGDNFLKGGVGVRVPTLIIVSAIYPDAFVELDLHPVDIEASMGGLLFGLFGLGVSKFTLQPYVLPDLNVSVELAPWFRLGGGVELFMPFDGSWSENFLYMVYVGARFVFVVK